MSRILTWDLAAERMYETGVKNGVLYVKDGTTGKYGTGVVWNGLISVTESPSGAEPTPLYADDMKYLNLLSVEEFAATVEAYMYPEAFAACNGEASLGTGVSIGQQKRSEFALCYRTTVGNAEAGGEVGYKLHIIYGCLAAPSERAYSTINDSPEAITFSWEVSTTPVPVTGHKATSYVCIDSTKVEADALDKIEKYLYGFDGGFITNPKLLMPDEIKAILDNPDAPDVEPNM